MDVSQISQSTINNNIKNSKKYMSKQDVADCKEGLFYADNNQDGKTTGIDMYKEWSETCNFVFQGNDTFLKRGQELATDIGEIYSRYAGEDGVLSSDEFSEAVQTSEYKQTVRDFFKLTTS